MSSRNELDELRIRARDAANDYTWHLGRAWPTGSEIDFRIQHGQKNPSRGEVLGHSGEYVVARMRTTTPYGPRFTIRRLPASQIITDPQP